ncbi:hypothetical protein A33Q_4685 [Indibacter alkaliphilus LW1]|uniref:Uncharacterized protein n=1 Tax=Indibacter alkaliphilus (strain CCUG 57479 / KCTC 22604 / LW1) TaxID=1189612 RepID=S2DGP1_INDAL|nr:hypothetical protein [Indibacter alkaliphilus]EOZ91296.1 hypothetical protein A33Q_4685 [Indibacter alkaliphilus LW1]
MTYNINVFWDQKDGFLSIHERTPNFQGPDYNSLKKLAESTVTSADEKGPYSYKEANDNIALLFSRKHEGVYSIIAVSKKNYHQKNKPL